MISVSDEMSWSHLERPSRSDDPAFVSRPRSRAWRASTRRPLRSGERDRGSRSRRDHDRGPAGPSARVFEPGRTSNRRTSAAIDPRAPGPRHPGRARPLQTTVGSDARSALSSITDLDALPRIAVPITVGTQKLGSIWAIEGEKELDARPSTLSSRPPGSRRCT